MKPDFKREFLMKYLGAQNELREEHYRAEPLPYFEPMDYGEWLNNLAAGGHSMPSYFGYAVLPGEDPAQYHGWTMFFLNLTQGCAYDGTGLLVRYATTVDRPLQRMIANPTAGRFAICEHEKVLSPDANPERGWRPGFCKLCGLNMTVDSSD